MKWQCSGKTLAVDGWHGAILGTVEEQGGECVQRRQQRVEVGTKQALLRGAHIAGDGVVKVASPGSPKLRRRGDTAEQWPDEGKAHMHELGQGCPCEHG